MGYAAKHKLVLIATLLLLLMVASVLGYSYFLKKSPKYLYLQAEAKHVQQLTNHWVQHYGPGWELYNMVQAQPFRLSSAISGNFQFEGLLGSLFNQQLAGVQESLRQTRLSITLDQQPTTEQYLTNMELNIGETKLFSAEFYQEPGVTALRFPDFYERYFYLGNHQFGSVVGRINPAYQGTEQIPELAGLKDGGQLVEQFDKRLLARYGQFIWSQLEEEMFTLEKIPYSTSQGEFTARKITLQMSSTELHHFFQGLSQALQADQELTELLRELDMQEKASFFIKQMEQVHFPQGITMQIILDPKGHILARQAKLHIAHQGFPVAPEGIELNYASKQTATEVLIDTDFIIAFAAEELAEELIGSMLPGLSQVAGQLEVPRIRGSIRQEFARQVPADEAAQQVKMQLFIDANSRLLGKQSLGLKVQMENKIKFTENLLFPMIERDKAIHLAGLPEVEWRQLLSSLEAYFRQMLEQLNVSSVFEG